MKYRLIIILLVGYAAFLSSCKNGAEAQLDKPTKVMKDSVTAQDVIVALPTEIDTLTAKVDSATIDR